MKGETSPVSACAIETEGLTRSFGSHLALDGIDLRVSAGECLAILGPNGAGKTTLIKVLATIMNPSAGKMFIAGLNPRTDVERIRARIGVVTHHPLLYSNLTGYENLEFYGRLYDVPEADSRIHEVAEMVGMTVRLHDRAGTLSRGMQQRLSIARALLHRPEIVLLDEPETGLDQDALSVVWKVLKGAEEQKRTIVFTSHQLERVIELSDRVVILNEGRIAHEQTKQDLCLTGLEEAYRACTRGPV